MGRQQISQSSTYSCRDTLKSNSIVIGCQQYGQANSYSISMRLVYTPVPLLQQAKPAHLKLLMALTQGTRCPSVSPPTFFLELSRIGQQVIQS